MLAYPILVAFGVPFINSPAPISLSRVSVVVGASLQGEYSEREVLRPGFVRLNFPFFMDEKTVDFVLEALCFIAKEGWKLLPEVGRDACPRKGDHSRPPGPPTVKTDTARHEGLAALVVDLLADSCIRTCPVHPQPRDWRVEAYRVLGL